MSQLKRKPRETQDLTPQEKMEQDRDDNMKETDLPRQEVEEEHQLKEEVAQEALDEKAQAIGEEEATKEKKKKYNVLNLVPTAESLLYDSSFAKMLDYTFRKNITKRGAIYQALMTSVLVGVLQELREIKEILLEKK